MNEQVATIPSTSVVLFPRTEEEQRALGEEFQKASNEFQPQHLKLSAVEEMGNTIWAVLARRLSPNRVYGQEYQQFQQSISQKDARRGNPLSIRVFSKDDAEEIQEVARFEKKLTSDFFKNFPAEISSFKDFFERTLNQEYLTALSNAYRNRGLNYYFGEEQDSKKFGLYKGTTELSIIAIDENRCKLVFHSCDFSDEPTGTRAFIEPDFDSTFTIELDLECKTVENSPSVQVSDINIRFSSLDKTGEKLLNKVIDFEQALLKKEDHAEKAELVKQGLADTNLHAILFNLFFTRKLRLENLLPHLSEEDRAALVSLILTARKNSKKTPEHVELLNKSMRTEDLITIIRNAQKPAEPLNAWGEKFPRLFKKQHEANKKTKANNTLNRLQLDALNELTPESIQKALKENDAPNQKETLFENMGSLPYTWRRALAPKFAPYVVSEQGKIFEDPFLSSLFKDLTITQKLDILNSFQEKQENQTLRSKMLANISADINSNILAFEKNIRSRSVTERTKLAPKLSPYLLNNNSDYNNDHIIQALLSGLDNLGKLDILSAFPKNENLRARILDAIEANLLLENLTREIQNLNPTARKSLIQKLIPYLFFKAENIEDIIYSLLSGLNDFQKIDILALLSIDEKHKNIREIILRNIEGSITPESFTRDVTSLSASARNTLAPQLVPYLALQDRERQKEFVDSLLYNLTLEEKLNILESFPKENEELCKLIRENIKLTQDGPLWLFFNGIILLPEYIDFTIPNATAVKDHIAQNNLSQSKDLKDLLDCLKISFKTVGNAPVDTSFPTANAADLPAATMEDATIASQTQTEAYEEAKKEAFRVALSQKSSSALLTLDALPNDPYGVQKYVLETANPGFFKRIFRFIFRTKKNVAEKKLSILAKKLTPLLSSHETPLPVPAKRPERVVRTMNTVGQPAELVVPNSPPVQTVYPPKASLFTNVWNTFKGILSSDRSAARFLTPMFSQIKSGRGKFATNSVINVSRSRIAELAQHSIKPQTESEHTHRIEEEKATSSHQDIILGLGSKPAPMIPAMVVGTEQVEVIIPALVTTEDTLDVRQPLSPKTSTDEKAPDTATRIIGALPPVAPKRRSRELSISSEESPDGSPRLDETKDKFKPARTGSKIVVVKKPEEIDQIKQKEIDDSAAAGTTVGFGFK